jgi:hypothetical protein
VLRRQEEEIFYKRYKSTWFFDANVFKDIKINIIELTTMYRQKDEQFITLLNNIRNYEDIDNTIKILNEKCCKEKDAEMMLTPTNALSDEINSIFLDEIESKEKIYYGKTSGKMSVQGDKLPVPEELILKVGARVMVRKNIDGAVNGSLGEVVELDDDYVYVELDNGSRIYVEKETWKNYKYSLSNDNIVSEEIGTYTQIPLILGWSITGHKSQGVSLDFVKLNFGGGCFTFGLAYVMLSRCRTLEGLSFTKPLEKSDIMIDSRITEFYQEQFGDGI